MQDYVVISTGNVYATSGQNMQTINTVGASFSSYATLPYSHASLLNASIKIPSI